MQVEPNKYIYNCSCHCPHPRLCIHALLCTKAAFLAAYALKCSSWSAVNQGTSGRAPCASLGISGYPSVDLANMMGSRILGYLTFGIKLVDHHPFVSL